jgi:hypothetical protein
MRFYIYGDGALWRVSHKAIREATQPWHLLEQARMLRSVEYNWNTGLWRNLPEGLYQGEQHDARVGSEFPDVEVVHYDDLDDAIRHWKNLLDGVRRNPAPAALAARAASIVAERLVMYAVRRSVEVHYEACKDPEGFVRWMTSKEGTARLDRLSQAGAWLFGAWALDILGTRKKAFNAAIKYLKTPQGREQAVALIQQTC